MSQAVFYYIYAMIQLENYVRNINDFPKPGIAFKDITPLLLSPEAVNYCVDVLIDGLENTKIDKVIGVESRGFFLASLMAQKLHAGFIPVRKKGKLPAQTIQAEYQLEYGTDVLEMHLDAIKPGDKIIIHDDVLATGGTIEAVCNMAKELGAEIIRCNFIIELNFLKGRNKIEDLPIVSAIQY